MIRKNEKYLDINIIGIPIILGYRSEFGYCRVTPYPLKSLLTSLCGWCNLVLEKYNLQTSFCGSRLVAYSPMILLHQIILQLKVSNVYNCNIMRNNGYNAYWAFAAFWIFFNLDTLYPGVGGGKSPLPFDIFASYIQYIQNLYNTLLLYVIAYM